jgi:membrane-bound lytic murein transglycosylase F
VGEIRVKLITMLFLGFSLTFCSSENNLLEQVKMAGELQVATRLGLTTYYTGPRGQAGLEYDLAKRFADELGVRLNMIVVDDLTEIIAMVGTEQVHFAAAGLAINHERTSLLRFTPPYQVVTQQFVYRQDSSPLPADLGEFDEKHLLKVVNGSYQVHLLERLQKNYPQLRWQTLSEMDPSTLLEQIWEGSVNYAVVNSNEVTRMRHFYPELQIGLELLEQGELAWAFPRDHQDSSLYLAAIQFFNRLKQSGELEQLIERYYGHIEMEPVGEVSARVFYRHMEERLPRYRQYFEAVAARYHLDWRLLAAIGYQESHWNPRAVSVTGVKGVMMLTKSTAREMGIADREDPLQSIEGGAKYFKAIKERVDLQIAEPDRTWFALAAYNVGFGHFTDACKLTEQRGGNPQRWVDVKKNLPLLTEKVWYDKTIHGYARGNEPVEFVKNVRRFYDMLVRSEVRSASADKIPSSPRKQKNGLSNSPS